MKILGIETSCDETAIAVLRAEGDFDNPKFNVLSNIISSQVALHAQYGGVVPNLAKREHIKNLPRVYENTLTDAGKSISDINCIAVTVGPGLEPALWTGIDFARKLAEKYEKPLIAVNHMEGHIASVLLDGESSKSNPPGRQVNFPAVALLVSGGHTELLLVKDWLDYELIGETRDDAAGEAFDKIARMLGLPYPGGPKISSLAEKISKSNIKIKLPRPMLNSGNFDFSFSGLKTAVLYLLRDNPNANKAEVAREFQQAVVDVLVSKTIRAVQKYEVRSVILGGGVSSNKELRRQLAGAISHKTSAHLLLPDSEYTTDNAAMIGAAAYFHALKQKFISPTEILAQCCLQTQK